MPGQGCPKQSTPDTSLPSTVAPSLSFSTGSTPKKGSVADPGLVGVAPGSGAIMMPPFSVCQKESTTAQRPARGVMVSWAIGKGSG